jgi:hypothetical protein
MPTHPSTVVVPLSLIALPLREVVEAPLSAMMLPVTTVAPFIVVLPVRLMAASAMVVVPIRLLSPNTPKLVVMEVWLVPSESRDVFYTHSLPFRRRVLLVVVPEERCVYDIVGAAYRDKVDASDLGMKKVMLRDLLDILGKNPNVDSLIFTGGNSKNGPEYFFRQLQKNKAFHFYVWTIKSRVNTNLSGQ